MRIYYIFSIQKAFLLLYKDRPSLLYKNFYQIYKMNNESYNIGLKIYDQLIVSFNKNELNEYIFNKHKLELSYTKDGNIHLINNVYTGEITKLTVRNTYIKIITNKNCPSFFNTLYENIDNIFICDFNNHDYFWLDKSFKEMLV